MPKSELPSTCCQCGMERANWTARQGYEQDGDVFCCQRCAQETGCDCEAALRQQRFLSKPVRRTAPRPAMSAGRPARA